MDIAHRRLHSLRLSTAPFDSAAEAVHWLGAVQSQDFSGALWGLSLRMRAAGERDLVRAFDAGEIVRTHLLRPTWHFVHPRDVRWMLALTAPRVHGVNGTIYRRVDLDAATLGRCQTILAKALKGGAHLTRDELSARLAQAGIADPTGLRLVCIVMAAELEQVVISGPRRGKQFTYALLDERIPEVPKLDRTEALTELARRYFASRGPASAHDFARWSGLTVTDARVGLEAVSSGLSAETVEGQTLWSTPDDEARALPAPKAFLLSIFDEFVAGYRDRSAICAPRFTSALEAMGNGLLYIIVIDGQIVGTWRRTFSKTTVTIELVPLRRFTAAEKRAVADAAERYGAYLGLSVAYV